ncbi:MAG: tetratricopeptide repeat protein [Bryobacteraceae bacterium]
MACPAWIVLLALAASSCATRRVVSQTPITPVAGRQTVFERQIANARDAGDGDLELRELREQVAAEPDNVAVRLDLARAYVTRGYPDVALEIARLAAARFPDSGPVELALVRYLHELHQPAEAISSLEGFLKSHPQTAPQYFSWLGILHDQRQEYALGEPDHRRAVELAPEDDSLHNNLGYNLLMQKREAEATQEFRRALKLNASSQVARDNLALALAGQNQNAEAVAAWQTASDPATAHSNLAAVLIEKGNYAEARKELKVALGYNAAHPAALKNLELVARLDGKPATVPFKSQETFWGRVRNGFVRLWVNPPEATR